MDGDVPTRYRRIPAPSRDGMLWSYSASLPADLGHPMTAQPGALGAGPLQARAPRADMRPRRPPARQDPARQDDDSSSRQDEDQSQDDDEDDGDEDGGDEEQGPPIWKRPLYIVIGLLVLAALIVAGVLYWLHARQYESTDDAFIDGYISRVSAQVAARVTQLEVRDNETVTAGQVILRLDPRDYQVKVEQAKAQRAQAAAELDQARAQLQLQQANLDQARAQVRVAQADLGQQQSDLARYRAIDPKAITKQQLDTSNAQTKSAAARLDSAKQAVGGAQAQIEAQKAQIEASTANLGAADVAVANAELQLSYTEVTAPQNGKVTNRSVDVGNYVNPGQALLAIVPSEMWVTANFKETQLAEIKIGQHVRVSVDACPDAEIAAHVQSFQAGTGAVFSSLPAENATGNYVKVVQRLPVKIVFDHAVDNCRLAPGLSVEPRVTVR